MRAPPEPSMRLVIDTLELGMKHTRVYDVICMSGYHIREAGSTAIQELAFTLRDGIECVMGHAPRPSVDQSVPVLS